jgi:hypothetical protein
VGGLQISVDAHGRSFGEDQTRLAPEGIDSGVLPLEVVVRDIGLRCHTSHAQDVLGPLSCGLAIGGLYHLRSASSHLSHRNLVDRSWDSESVPRRSTSMPEDHGIRGVDSLEPTQRVPHDCRG